MKTDKLMLGDWVGYIGAYEDDSGEIVEMWERPIPIKITFITPDAVQYEDEDGCYECMDYELHPIPLTAEILEKNGFIKVRDFLWEIRTQDTCIKYEWHGKIMLEITKKLTRKDKYGRCNIAAFTVGWMDDMFVHELQHALRLCGIEKEIEL